mmetsp:Transcript_43704/g.95259  ORF Transcript_43704/g.95259 Transcript_43704/m.95259 type:complete len:270 (-) Transcript_43704:166-975(-)
MNPGTVGKKLREVYVGGMQPGMTPKVLKTWFSEMITNLPAYKVKYRDSISRGQLPVLDATVNETKNFAFVEFATEELASTAIEFDRAQFFGANLKIKRPTGVGLAVTAPLDVKPYRDQGILPPPTELHAQQQQLTAAWTVQAKKQRELYIGNLQQGVITRDNITMVVNAACQHLPEYQPELGPVVLNVDMSADGKYCFVEFQSDVLATQGKEVLNDLELVGRRLIVDRPQGYLAPDGTVTGVRGTVLRPDPLTGLVKPTFNATAGFGTL